MNPVVANRLKLCNNLPSLPSAATRIVELARDPQAGMRDVADAVRMDPALSAKLLRMANSPMYARRRPCETFQQALVLLGLNATLTLALTFSLVSAMRKSPGNGLDYSRLWRRSLLSATAARALGVHFGLKDIEELFLAGLMQDIGMLALDVGYPELYEGLSAEEQEHETLRRLERSHLDSDHAAVGQWLLERWNLPPRLVEAVGRSHDLEEMVHPDEAARFRQAVAFSGPVADVWMDARPDVSLREMQIGAVQIKGLEGEALVGVLEAIAQEMPEIETMFEIELLDQDRSEWVLQEAREVLVFRNLQMLQESAQLREVASSLKAQALALEEKSNRDNLTGAFNRGYMDAALIDWFSEAGETGSPLSLVFIDLDDFKRVNDRHGHHTGDMVLRHFSEALQRVVRGSDIVARYGGEEFVLLLKTCGSQGAQRFCERLLSICRSTEYSLEDGGVLHVTASMGLVTHGETSAFPSSAAMLRAADDALYKAKQAGKDRVVVSELQAHAA